MAKGGQAEARGIAAISALIGKQHKKKTVGKIKNIHEEKEKSDKAAAKKAAASKSKEKTSKAEPKADKPTAPSGGTKSASKQFKQKELNFKPPKPKSEAPRKPRTSKRASGPNPTHARNADTGKLEKMSPDVQKEVAQGIKSFDEKKASYSPPKLKAVNLE